MAAICLRWSGRSLLRQGYGGQAARASSGVRRKQAPERPRSGRATLQSLKAGFSLAEVSVAMGIFAIAVLPMMALLSLGTDWGRESAIESRATFLARALVEDLRSYRATGEARLAPDVTLPEFRETLLGFDAFGQPLGSASSSYEGGDASGRVIYLARVSSAVSDPSLDSLGRVEISIEHPGYLPEGQRKRFTFYALMRVDPEEEPPADEETPPAS